MQSQLEAALLGHTNLNQTANVDDDETNYQDEEEGSVEDFVDEDGDGDNGIRVCKHLIGSSSTTRTVTLQMLLSAGILEPGNGTMSIEYLVSLHSKPDDQIQFSSVKGQRFVGDLLEDGKIRSQETDIVFASPSAWAIACKRFINPEKKSGCGWASVKYKGKKLDAYKNIWYKKRKEELNQEREVMEMTENIVQKPPTPIPYHRIAVKHNTVANRTLTHDANTLIECVPFSALGKIQPFLLSLSTNAALLMDFHSHLTKSEICGYLGGHWDVNTHNLQITDAFPCRHTKSDRENAAQIENDIQKAMEKEKLTLIGWYHSHPHVPAAPTLRDIDAQLDYQIKMKGTTDNNYTPCVGVILSPYNIDNTSLESSIVAFWVVPPPETKPNEYGRPMLMSYSVIQDSVLTPKVRDEMKRCVDYYKKENDYVNFGDIFMNNTLYIDKLKGTLLSKFPREENESSLWGFVKETLGYAAEENDSLLSIPNVNKNLMANLPTINPNLMLTGDISSLLFNSGKFPSSLLGLPDPMAHSTLAANNMFLSTNLFKMQELLKPLSSSSPLPTPKKSPPPIKIPTDYSGKKSDFVVPKDFSVPDLALNFTSKPESGEKAPKIAKNDFLDLSVRTEEKNSDEKPLNLAPESSDCSMNN